MSRRVSPFAALTTGAEKQIKWLEYQSIRLPYVQGSVDASMDTQEQVKPDEPKAEAQASAQNSVRHTENKPAANPTPATAQKHSEGKSERGMSQPKPIQAASQRQKPSSMNAADFQQTRHRQYDAVIARMKQAEQRTSGYNQIS